MSIKLIGIKNPHKAELNYPVKDDSLFGGSIWRMYINPERVDFLREVRTDDKNYFTEIGIGGHVFKIDCTLEALIELIRNGEDVLTI